MLCLGELPLVSSSSSSSFLPFSNHSFLQDAPPLLLRTSVGGLFPSFSDSSYKPGIILFAIDLTLSLLAALTVDLLQPLTGDLFVDDGGLTFSFFSASSYNPGINLPAIGLTLSLPLSSIEDLLQPLTGERCLEDCVLALFPSDGLAVKRDAEVPSVLRLVGNAEAPSVVRVVVNALAPSVVRVVANALPPSVLRVLANVLLMTSFDDLSLKRDAETTAFLLVDFNALPLSS